MPYKNPEDKKAQGRKYYQLHKPYWRQAWKKYYDKNRDKLLKQDRDEHAANPAKKKDRRMRQRDAQPWAWLVKGAKGRAAKKKVPFLLPADWAEKQWTGFCAVTGLPFDLTKRGSGPAPRSPSIDRIRPEIGYTPGNCRIILLCINWLKHTGTDEEMMEVVAALMAQKALPVMPVI